MKHGLASAFHLGVVGRPRGRPSVDVGGVLGGSAGWLWWWHCRAAPTDAPGRLVGMPA